MFRNPSVNRVRQMFADQFVCESRGVVYRKAQKGAPIRVSDLERDKFIATFNKRVRYVVWSTIPSTLVLIVLLVWLFPNVDTPAANAAVWIGFAAILMPSMAIFYRAWNAPARELERRAPEGMALTKKEARTLALSKITYGQLSLAAIMSVGLMWRMSWKTDIFHGWSIFWVIFGGGMVALAGIQAIRKLCLDRSRGADA